MQGLDENPRRLNQQNSCEICWRVVMSRKCWKGYGASSRYVSGSHTAVSQCRTLHALRNETRLKDERDLTDVMQLSHRAPSNDTPLLLPTVLKNISSPNSAIRKLVYIHLLNSAERDQDTALLAINSIQKALSASDPQLRALALRTMSGLRVPVIAQIVSLAIKKGVGDMSPIVRRAAALAIPKCWRLDPSNSSQLEEYLSILLGDKQYYVAGAAAMAMTDCCRDRIDLLHKHYRSLTRKLVDMDEWSQLATLRLLTSYARRCFPRRTKRVKRRHATANVSVQDQGFYDEDFELGEEAENSIAGENSYVDIVDAYDLDLELLLKSAQSLLQSRNSAVIIAITRLYLAVTNPSKTISRNGEEQQSPSPYITSTLGPLISLMRASPSIAHMALVNILQVALKYPALFVQHVRHFLVRGPGTGKGVDSFDTAALKLEMLALMFPYCAPHAQSLILMELENTSKRASQASQPVDPLTYYPNHAVNSQQRQLLVTTAIRALGRCARSSAAASSRCMTLLMKLVSSPADSLNAAAGIGSNPLIISEALTVLRHLIQTDPTAHTPTVIRLAKRLDSQTHNPQARANIIWLVGEFAGVDMHAAGAVGEGPGQGNVAPDVLRILVKKFAQEPEIVKKQIVLLAAKVYLHYLNDLQQSGQSQPRKSPETSVEPGVATDTDPSPAPSSLSLSPPISSHSIPKLYSYVHQLVRYDTSYALRDFARTHQALLADPLSLPESPSDSSINTQLATLLLHAPKPVPSPSSPSAASSGLVLGSASLAASAAETARGGSDGGKASVGAGTIKGYADLPERVRIDDEPDPRLREEVEEGGYRGVGGAMPASRRLGEALGPTEGGMAAVGPEKKAAGESKGKSFDDWLDEDEHENEEGIESETDSEKSGDSEETEEEDSEENEEESSSDEEAGERVPLTHE